MWKSDQRDGRAAIAHSDRHVIKMIVESAQLLSTAHVFLDGSLTASARVPKILKATHSNHPSARWVRSSAEAYEWVHQLMGYLILEHFIRWGSRAHVYSHGGRSSLWAQLSTIPLNMPLIPASEPAQVVPPCCRRSNAVGAYRAYYCNHKSHIATWKPPRTTPDWWQIPDLSGHLHTETKR